MFMITVTGLLADTDSGSIIIVSTVCILCCNYVNVPPKQANITHVFIVLPAEIPHNLIGIAFIEQCT